MGPRFALVVSATLIACGIDQTTEVSGANGGVPGVGGDAGGAAFGGSAASGGTAGVSGSGGTIEGGSGGVAGGAPGGGAPPTGGTGGGPPVSATAEYIATVADCVGATAPNPDVCAAAYSELHLDISADYLGATTSLVYLRFDADNQLAGATVTSAELVLTNVNGSVNSGEVHEVAAFQRPDLFVQAPGLGPVIAADVGAVGTGQAVTWSLGSMPKANQPFCVGLSTNTSDGIGYATLSSPTPPKLRVTFSK